ncbi:MAG: beta strand repeat-containing protein, partial [Pirellulales bacterium]
MQLQPGDTQEAVTQKLILALDAAIADGNFNPLSYNLSDIGNGRVEVGGAATTSIVVDPLASTLANGPNLTGTSGDPFPLVLWGSTNPQPLVGNSGPGGTGAFNFWFNVGPTVHVDKLATATPGNTVEQVGFNDTQPPSGTGGTFTLTFQGKTTGPLPENATAAQVQTALQNLPNIGAGNVAVTRTNSPNNGYLYTVTFQNALGTLNQPQITIDTTSLTFNLGVVPTKTQSTLTVGGPYNTINAALQDSAVLGAAAAGQEVNVRVEPNAHATMAIANTSSGIALNQTFSVVAGPYTFNFQFVATGTAGAPISPSNPNLAVVIGSIPNPSAQFVATAIFQALNAATITLNTGRIVSLTAADGGNVTVTYGIDGDSFNSPYYDGNYYYVYLFQGAQPITVNAQTTPFNKALPGVPQPFLNINNTQGNTNNLPYLVGTDQFNNLLPDDSPSNSILQLPKNTVLMVDAGAVFKLRQANIEAGSSAVNIDQSQSAIQVLGIPGQQPVFTSYNDDTGAYGGAENHPGVTATAGDWGGLVFNNDSDLETLGVFMNSVNAAKINYGGGRVVVNGLAANYDSVYLATARPAVTNDTIINGAGAAISANPDSFESSHFGSDLTITINSVPQNLQTFQVGTVTFEFLTNGSIVTAGDVGIALGNNLIPGNTSLAQTTQVANLIKAAINADVLVTTNPGGQVTLIDQAQSLGALVTLPANTLVGNGVTPPTTLTVPTTIGSLTFTPDLFSADYQRFGPDVYGNVLTTGPANTTGVAFDNPNNTTQQLGLVFTGQAQDKVGGILVRINTSAGQALDTLDVSAVFAATDIPY